VTYQSLHDALCADGDDACGGPFEHKRCIDELVHEAIRAIYATHTTPAVTDVPDTAMSDANTTNVVATAVAGPAVVENVVNEAVDFCVTPRPQITENVTQPSMTPLLTDSTH
jgi:hypothetical protein